MAASVLGSQVSLIGPLPRGKDRRSGATWDFHVESFLSRIFVRRTKTSTSGNVVIFSLLLEPDHVYAIEAWTIGRRESGGGSLNDGYVRIVGAFYKNKGGTVSAVGVGVDELMEETDNVNFSSDVNVNGATLEFRVNGDAGVGMAWAFRATILRVNS